MHGKKEYIRVTRSFCGSLSKSQSLDASSPHTVASHKTSCIRKNIYTLIHCIWHTMLWPKKIHKEELGKRAKCLFPVFSDFFFFFCSFRLYFLIVGSTANVYMHTQQQIKFMVNGTNDIDSA